MVSPPLPDVSPKRRQIVTAAEALFLARGYGAVSMDAIARSAEVSKATLYAHFASKDALFAGIMADKGSFTPIDPELFETDIDDVAAALTRIGERVLRFMLLPRTLAIYRVAMAESVRFPELGRAFYDNGPQRFLDRFRVWAGAQDAAGRLAADDTDMAAHQFMALIRSAVFLRASLGLSPPADDTEIDATVRAAVATFLKAFGPARGGTAAP